MRKVLLVAPILSLLLYAIYYMGHPRRSLPDVRHIALAVNIQRLDKELFSLPDKVSIQAFLKKYPTFSAQFLGLDQPTPQDALVEQLDRMIKDPHMQELYREVEQRFGDLTEVEQQLIHAFRYLKHYYPDAKIPQVATFITGMGTDLYVSEELLVIGLDFFIGKEAKFRPIHLPEYLLQGYQPAHMVPKMILLLAQQFIHTDEGDTTLLADMLYYGKAYYFAQTLLPQVAPSTLLGYTTEQLAEVEGHRGIVWEHVIEQELLYTTNPLTKNKYLRDRPFVAEIGPKCPGNIGRWLGWEVIKSYMRTHPEVDLPTLMNNKGAQALLSAARYRPY